MKVIVPLAGRGSRFERHKFEVPKPLIPVAGKPMIYWALKSLEGMSFTEIIFVALEEHEKRWGITRILRDIVGSKSNVLLLSEVTDGQLCTVLAARNHISSDCGVLIISSDTYVVSNLGETIRAHSPDCRGVISVANMPGVHWSFAQTNDDGYVTEVAEKIRISDHASTGLYYFSSGQEFLEAADEMITSGEKTRGEYYVIPTYGKYIQRGWRVEVDAAHEVWDMGTPESLAAFERAVAALTRA